DFSLGVAARLGELLGGYHAHAGARARGAEAESVFPRGVPWILDVVRHNPGHVGPVGPAAREYLDIVTAQPALAAALDAARDGWRRDALVHGDMKWENVLVLPAAEGGGPELRIVDWELGDFGDACWDVGSLFQSYLSCWVLSIADPHAGAAALPGQARFPLERMQPAMAAFWESYVRTRGADPREAAELLRRSMAYAAARMLQTAWEHAVAAPALAPNVLHLLQVGMNVLTRPDDAVVHLLGFEQRRAA
ncbi:MAG TPA: phosphotransferase, partial [Longimicrobium sp.]|nr:phosphotransferase [Longimicrobium sp.]